MTRSTKLGVAGCLLLGCYAAVSFWISDWPFIVACAAISGLLGSMAARRGSKWWLAIPLLSIVWSVILAYMTQVD